jgi:RND family efflux transporter MFP subunit
MPKKDKWLAAWLMATAIGAASLTASAAETDQPTEPSVATNKVQLIAIDDLKAVFAVVQSARVVPARARIGGTIAALSVEEGSEVAAGQQIAEVTDQKLALKIESLEAQIKGLQSRVTNARADLDRAEQLIQRGFATEAKVGELRTAHDVAVNQLKSAVAERRVVTEQVGEGAVLAPAGGRVLTTPVTPGSVIMPGESIATIAINRYILRLEIPERHARFIKVGDKIRVGARGLNAAGEAPVGEGKIVKVYPELRDGRVVADAEVDGLGGYFVGERAVVWISAGKREAIVIPREYVFRRAGMDYVRLTSEKGAPVDVVVQLGQPAVVVKPGDAIEALAGLRPGDALVKP